MYVLAINSKDSSEAVFYTSLTYLCHTNVGFYCSLVSMVTMLLSISANEFSLRHAKEALKRTIKLHAFTGAYLSWWLIPLLISYMYAYNVVSSHSGPAALSLTGLVDMFTNGNLFSYRQQYHTLTLVVALGLLVAVKNLRGMYHFNSLQFNPKV